MAARLMLVLSVCAAASALPVLQYQPYQPYQQAEAAAPAHYEFAYSVSDAHSGDVKQQQEARAGDAVQGSYSLVQPDGVNRIVHYTADKEHGFNAVVSYEGHPTEAPAKIAYAAVPAKVAYAAAPVKIAYAAAPVQKIAYAAAPVHKIAYDAQPLSHVNFASPAISYHH